MSLAYPDASSVAQVLRMLRRSLARDQAILVVEGASDKRALMPVLSSKVVCVPATGKEKVVGAYGHLSPGERQGMLFIVDCDGNTDPMIKGRRDLILSVNRDLDADLIFELAGFRRVAMEALSEHVVTVGELEDAAADLLRVAADIATLFGLIHRFAVEERLSVRVADAASGKRRKLRLGDLPSSATWLRAAAGESVAIAGVSAEIAKVLGWAPGREEEVLARASAHQVGQCRKHSRANCRVCLCRSYANGHLLIEALSVALEARYGLIRRPRDLEASVRVAADFSRVAVWEVWSRMKAWQDATECKVLAT